MTVPGTPPAPAADLARLAALHRTMCRIRAFEQAAERAFEQGLMLGALHVSIGQEAVAAGVCAHLEDGDVITSTHRGHGHALAKGLDPQAMMEELLGRAGGTCGGKGGSMHLADLRRGLLGANGIVADGITIAAGAAHELKRAGGRHVAVAFFGDGGINRGPFFEALNWAAAFALPLLFVCEDNGFASTTRTSTLSAGPGADARAIALGVPAVAVDGNDVAAVDAAAGALLGEIRAGGGPRLLLARTYRLRGHTANDPARYRTDAEVAEAQERDPLRLAEDGLARGGAPRALWEDVLAQETAAMEEVLEAATAGPFPAPERAWDDVQDLGRPEPRAAR
ncbi:thiamine pyrophosphate-dependent dehydrogenase E1 component subunit alpha [Baekduia soli]|uniref:Thiamine pyrophosphate-dependent dehydrogenase E1 component subunit alpha n=1 Tax=Baekduia soli TaxID=496014 RepID=A0A5B8U1A5_9ACTN|nr:thiamine pyrophosphate-dependent dehydrogenase E1 component subunit alpha [Baekduia soli]QEC46758.1 thiamine pyrophosphate-dependent dehydrogenase E1 component subunit alpha [Baekduia soli]